MNTAGARPVPHRVTVVKPKPPAKSGHGSSHTTVVVTPHHSSDDDLSPAGIFVLALFFAALLACLAYFVARR